MRDQLGEGSDGQAGTAEDHVRGDGGHARRGEVAVGVPAGIGAQRRVGAVIAGILQQQGVAVGAGAGGGHDADIAVAAGAVLDDDALAEQLAQRLLEQARGEVGAAAGRVGDDQRDRAGGPAGLGPRTGGCEQGGGEQGGGGEQEAARQVGREAGHGGSFVVRHRFG
jgi:hypothetical protein